MAVMLPSECSNRLLLCSGLCRQGACQAAVKVDVAQEPILALQRQLALLLQAPRDAAASRLTLARLAASSGHHQVTVVISQ